MSSNNHIPEEYELVEYPESIKSSYGSRLSLFGRELGFDRGRHGRSHESGLSFHTRWSESFSTGCSGKFVINPDGMFYRWWTRFILLWAIYSSFFTPFEFGFFRGLPKHLWPLDVTAQIIFFGDLIVQFFLAYRDSHSYKMVYDRRSIALRYFKTSFSLDFLGCFPWDILYKTAGREEGLRYLLWIRLYRVRKLTEFFQKMEKDIRINYLFTRIVKLIAVELYCTHTAACIFYYLATTLPESKEGFTWIGSLTLGDYHFRDFREISVERRYITSLYFAIVTMATVGYGDIHAVNTREMIFVMIYVSFDMILGAYLIGNMTALIVKGSKTERFRDRMTDLIRYMNRNKLGRDIRAQIKGHVRLQYESSYSEAIVLHDIPISIRAKVSQSLYMSEVEQVPLFKGCSSEFISQIVTRLHEEFFLPGEVIMEQGNAVDQLYIISSGSLEEILAAGDGLEDTISRLEPHSIFGEIAVLCKIPQPYTVRVCELCRLLRLEKQSFVNILQLYFKDGRQVLTNLLEGKETDLRIKQLESDITLLIAKQEAELALQVNSAAYHGDLYHLKNLIRAGEDPARADYDGRTALHLAASKGYEEITLFLIQAGADVNSIDKFGNTPLLEAVKGGHDRVASLLAENKASLILEDAGNFLCKVVASGNAEFLKRLLANGIDPNSKDYNYRTPLHMAAAEGLHLLAKILLDSGASVFAMDRWGNTPLDEGRKCGSKPLIQMLEEAHAVESTKGCPRLHSSTTISEGRVSSMDPILCTECLGNSDISEGNSFQKLGTESPISEVLQA
ncbi:hypothetical protein SUGI_0188180 [Cryptomeria japonica]|nr:hypothetical protein SUGI_0188180 [Cryptomeria japonica]